MIIAIDCETTGFSPTDDRIIEIAGTKFLPNGIEISNYQSLINPEISIPPEATVVNGITDEMVASAPTADKVLRHFFEWLDGPDDRLLIAHNLAFDLRMILAAAERLGWTPPQYQTECTLRLARARLAKNGSFALSALAERLGIVSIGFHRALLDCQVTKSLYLTLKAIGDPWGPADDPEGF